MLEASAAAGHKALLGRFLEDPHHPFARPVERIVSHHRGVDTHKGDRCLAAREHTALDGDLLGFVEGAFGTEEGQPGGTADVHAALGRVEEQAAADHDPAGAPFGLWPGALRKTLLAPEGAALDQPPVAADHVGCLPAPAFDRAVADHEVGHARELDRVVISLRPDVADAEPLQDDVVRRGVEAPAVVHVDPVAALAAHGDIAQRDKLAIGEVPALTTALEDRRVFLIGALDHDRALPRALQSRGVDPRGVSPRGDPDPRAGPRPPERRSQRSVVADLHHVLGPKTPARNYQRQNG